MSDYEPESRRPIAQVFRNAAKSQVDWCVRYRIHPNTISIMSVVFSCLAAACWLFAKDLPWLLLVAPILCFGRLWMNMLDGMVALQAKIASKRGELFNELPDRVSDLIVFTALAHSQLCHPLLAMWCGISAILTAYVGTFGQALGVGRQFGGIMAKPWRMVTLFLFSTTLFVWKVITGSFLLTGTLTWLDVANGLIVLGCLQTIWVRLKIIDQRLMKS